MNIILIITGLGVGGAECQVCDLADQYVGRGHRVLLISMTGETLVRPRSSDVEIATLNMQKSFVSFIRSFWLARRLINDFKPDVVHSHMVHANIFTRLLHISVPMSKLICTAHSIVEGGGIAPWLIALLIPCVILVPM